MSGRRSELQRFGLSRVDVVERFGDVEFADPYRLLEDESRAVQAWQAHQHARAGEALAATSGMAALTRELEAHLLADRLAAPVPAGGRWFWAERDASGAIRRVRVTYAPDEREGDVAAEAGVAALDGDEAIDWLVPSPDGRLLALGISSNGDEQDVLALVDVDSGALTGPPTRHVGTAAWLPDGRGLYLALGAAPSQELPLKRLAFQPLGGRAELVDAPPLAAATQLLVQVSPDGRRVALASDLGSPRLLYLHDRFDGSWTPVFPEPLDRVFWGAFGGDGYVAVTDVGQDHARLVTTPLASIAEPAGWRELLSGEEAVLRGVAPFGEQLLVCELEDGTPRLRLLDRDGAPRAQVPLPPGLVVSAYDRMRGHNAAGMPAQAGVGEIVFTASALARPTTLWRYVAGAGRLEELTEPDPQPPASVPLRLRSETRRCSAPDGTEVSYDLVWREDVPRDAPAPVLLNGYGGFNGVSLPLGWQNLFAPWTAAGGIRVHAHLRGDGTRGTAQWRGGRRGEKQHSIDDLLAVAQALVDEGVTTPAQLALMGASNGGLVAGAAITQRPELFRAAAILIPISDMGRLGRERFAEAFRAEYGDERIPEQARWRRGYSPYHHVEPGTAYPATIVAAGGRDMRTHAWHARKLAAALLDAAGGAPGQAPPVLLRVHRDRGHGTAFAAEPEHVAEWLGFLMDQVGLPLSP